MIGRSNSFLGVAVTDRAVVCAEVSVGSSERGRALRHTATFVFPSDFSLDAPAAAGQALAAFLRQKRFTASRVVVGIPARWLIAVEKELPPVNEEQMRAALRLQAERMAVSENGDVVFDFAGRPDPDRPNRILLVGMLRQRLDRIVQMMDAAGMSVMAVTSTGLAMACGISGSDPALSMLMLSASGAEVVVQREGKPRMLRHVAATVNGHGVPPLAPMGAELRRAVAIAPASPNNAVAELLLLDGVGLSSSQIDELAGRSGCSIRPGNAFEMLRLQGQASADIQMSGQFAPAVSLALAGAEPKLLPVDFRHSRLAPPPPRRISRTTTWGIALSTTILLVLILLFVSVRRQQAHLDDLTSKLAQIQPQLNSARNIVDRVTWSRAYFDLRPPMLDCLRQLSLTFRSDERIWVTNFTLRDNGKGTLTGKSTDQGTILNLVNRLKKNTSFANVSLGNMQEADQRSREMSFSISFDFSPVE